MNKSPLKPIKTEHIRAYQEDGVTCLRGMLDQDWITKMRTAADEVIADSSLAPITGPSHGEDFVSAIYMCRNEGPFRDFQLNSPVGEMVARTIGSKEIYAFQDHLFVKHIGSPHVMPWHHDMTTWPFDGHMVPTIWIALSHVTASNGRLEFVKGYHHHLVENDIVYTGHYPGGDFGPPGAVKCPNFWEELDTDKYEIVSWDLEPGDAVVFHPRTPHGSGHAKNATEPRIGLTSRWIGDDIRWNYREGNSKVPGIEDMPFGEPPRHALLPLVWSEHQDSAAA